ncbi:MAG: Ig-like domain-containing protein, partial [Nitrospiraceae bacterium]
MSAGLLGSSTTPAQGIPDQLLFGPKQYLRTTGPPNQYTDTFTVPASVGAPFLLHIVNGEANGSNRISSAWITLNEVQVAGPNDFGQTVAVVDRTVTLQPTNTLQVKVASAPGSYLTISVRGTKILPTPTTLTPNPLTITVGGTGTLTATLAPTPTAGGTLTAGSGHATVATVPATIPFASGQTQVSVPVTAVGVGSTPITVSANGGSATSTVQVTPQPPTVTSLLPGTLALTQGGTGTLTVTISAAQSTDTIVALSSTATGIASVPSSVTVLAGQTSTPVSVSGTTPGTAQIAASLNGTSVTSTVSVTPALPTVVSLLPPTVPLTPGSSGTLTVTLSAVQPTETPVALAVSPTGIITLPPTVTVPAGQPSVPVSIGTVMPGTALVQASLNGSLAEAAVHVTPPPPAVVSLLPSPLSVVTGASGPLTVTLNAVRLTNTSVTLTMDNPSVLQVPPSVTVPAGQLTASFTVTGSALGDAVVTTTLGASTRSATVHVVPPPPVILALVPTPLALQQGATGSVTLTINAAQPTDTNIPLTNTAPGIATVPSSVTVPAGQTSAAVPVTGLTPGDGSLTAALNGSTATAAIQVTTAATVVTGLTPGTLTLPTGRPGVLRVTVSPAPTAPAAVTLTSTNTTVASVPPSVPIPAGALVAEFPVLANGAGNATIMASLSGGTATAQVSVTPAELITLSLSPLTPAVFVGEPQAFTATGTFTDGTTQDLTTSANWTSSTESIATITSSGLAAALAVGTTTITAASGSLSVSTTLAALTPPVMTLIPASASLKASENLAFTLNAGAPAGPNGLVVTFTISGSGGLTVPASVTIPAGESSASFFVTGVSAGQVTLTASAVGRQPASSNLTVTPNVPPTVSGFSPAAGHLGTLVTLTGTNFDPTPSGNTVKFGAVAATVLSATATQLVARVPLGAVTAALSVTTTGGTVQTATTFMVLALSALAVTPGKATLPTGQTYPFHATGTFTDGSSLDVTAQVTWSSSNSGTLSVNANGLTQGVAVGTATITGSLSSFSATGAVQVIQGAPGDSPLPPDPVTVAPPVDRTVATTLATATAFLYSGSNPIQTGVPPGTITAIRAAVLRGKVSARDGFPLPGVTVTVLNHPEFGQTRTRPDGLFDLAVNGGGLVTVNYAKTGFLPAQRQVQVPWQDFTQISDVVLVPLDPQVTTIAMNASTMQTARGNLVTDTDGTRQATVLIPAASTATMSLPGGGTQPLTTVSVRATEYSVGATGPQAMPALLPPTSAYTYAVEYSVDEALAAGATEVRFNQPVVAYVENFLNFPVGTLVPSGFYDRTKGVWVPSANGRVIKVLTLTGGLADVDTDGDGAADAGVGLTTGERQRLAALYAVGQSLWRVPISHFSIWDFNWPPFGQGPAPKVEPTTARKPQPEPPDCQRRSVITCQPQALGESVPITGTPDRLHYQSERVPGRKDAYSLEIPASGSTVPATLKSITVLIQIAGRVFEQSLPPAPNQTFTFVWDGRDAYGRRVQGEQPATVLIGYVYDRVLGVPNPAELTAFARFPTGPIIGAHRIGVDEALFQSYQDRVGRWEPTAAGLGGWMVSRHHAYDPQRRVLYRGDGPQRSAVALNSLIRTVAGTGSQGAGGDGGAATAASLDLPNGVAVGPDGSVYIADTSNNRIRRVDANGIITTVAGNGSGGFSGDGGQALAAQLAGPVSLDVGPDGSLYIADQGNNRIRRVNPSGVITTVAGNGVPNYGGDGGPATAASLNFPWDVAISPDGSLYIADYQNARIRRVGTDGIITTVAGTGIPGYSGEGGRATAARINLVWGGVDVGPNGELYIADTNNHCIRRVGADGLIRTVAGRCTVAGLAGDGGPAMDALFFNPVQVKVAADGSLYIADINNHRIRWVSPTGIITTLTGIATSPTEGGYSGENGPASAARLFHPTAVTLAPDGSFYVADRFNHRIRHVAPPLPGLGVGDVLLPAEAGEEVYVFDVQGRHLRTVDPLTNAIRSQFAYTSAGFLASLTDGDGKTTTIERDGSGTATAMVAPGGQRTTVTTHGDGYLASIITPAGETTALTYATDGLLARLKDARANTHTYTYDTLGRLIKDEDPAGGFAALARTDQANGYTVSLSSTLGRTTSYQVERLLAGGLRRVTTDPSGLVTATVVSTNGTTTLTAPEGTLTTQVQGPDPRFGMQAPLLKSLSVQTPGGLTSTLSTTRTVTLTNPADPLSLASQTDTLLINGRSYTSTYTQATRLLSTTTPANRTSAVTLDAKGRVIQEQMTGLEPVSYTYDALGRLSTITQGSGTEARMSTLAYNSKNELINITDPLSRTVGFAYDLAGRITTQTLPDTRTIGYNYDANGNVTAITPPGKPAHAFAYTAVDLEQTYDPPTIGLPTDTTQYTYNLDRQLTLVTR